MPATKQQYKVWFSNIKESINTVKLQTALQVNTNMLMLYWFIGNEIIEKTEQEKWGSGVIKQLAIDLQKAFPDTKGFSERNLKYMRQFAGVYNAFLIGQEPLAQLKNTDNNNKKSATKNKNLIGQEPLAQLKNTPNNNKKSATKNKNLIGQEPLAQLAEVFKHTYIAQINWTHHVILLDKIKTTDERLWYIRKTIENKWSSTVLLHQIESGLYQRQYKTNKTTNFHLTLSKTQSDLALEIFKDPYKFDFLSLTERITEKELENNLVNQITKFLLELGNGFAFIGNQYKVKTPRKAYAIDMLFYHLKLKAYIVIELKMEAFSPGDASQLNFYLNLVDDFVKDKNDKPSIGILMCKAKDNFEVEYALRGLNKPIGVAEYKMLPKKIREQLPSSTQFRNMLKKIKNL
ncbi:MAG TPA: PDDEXK nuclease domain-containing protein [Chitinophagaceae bacterium]|nr:PDDEXK nuclease domain-containing protein [Chitinophagaceae bacterium]